MEREGLVSKIKESRLVGSIQFVQAAENKEFDEITIGEHIKLFPVWSVDWIGNIGSLVSHDYVIYKSETSVNSKEDNSEPSSTNPKWSIVAEGSQDFNLWVQPISTFDGYDVDAKVIHNGSVWVSMFSNNTSEPGVDPMWNKVEIKHEVSADQQLRRKIFAINKETKYSILAGFKYEVNGQVLHFNYDSIDQQNFTDAATLANLAVVTGQMEQTVDWNAYDSSGELVIVKFGVQEFLALYQFAIFGHKNALLEVARQKKLALHN